MALFYSFLISLANMIMVIPWLYQRHELSTFIIVTAAGLLVPEGSIHPVVCDSAQTSLNIYIFIFIFMWSGCGRVL